MKIDDLTATINKALSDYSDDVNDKVHKSVDKVTRNCVKKLKQTSPRRYGDYAKSWASKTVEKTERSRKKRVYNKEHYRLTHLLEFGHAKKSGGRVSEKPHIRVAEREAVAELINEIKKSVK